MCTSITIFNQVELVLRYSYFQILPPESSLVRRLTDYNALKLQENLLFMQRLEERAEISDLENLIRKPISRVFIVRYLIIFFIEIFFLQFSGARSQSPVLDIR